MRGEYFLEYLWCLDTLNIFLGCSLSFLRERIFGPFLLSSTFVGCRYYNIFLGDALSFLRTFTFLAPLDFTSLFLSLSLSLIYFTLLVVLFASASETNRLSFTEFLLQQGEGRVCTRGRGRGNSKSRGDK